MHPIAAASATNSQPPWESAPKPDKNAHHPRKLSNVAFWSHKRRSYTAKATTRRDASRCIPGRRFRSSKPPAESAPKPDRNAAPHHPRKLSNVAFWSPKRRSYTAKATTRRDASRCIPWPPLPQQQTTIRLRPKTDRNAAPHHPRKLSNVAFWSPKRRSYTAKATTRRDASRCIPWPPLPQQQTTIRLRPKTKQKRSATPPTKTL